MKFSKAIDRLITGIQITRPVWDENEYLDIRPSKRDSRKKELYHCRDNVFNSTDLHDCILTYDDITSTDWMKYSKKNIPESQFM